ncbi:MAG: uncharacterized protein QOD86_2875 [Miltoncostaeaceae bacterium]|nr:uncharacterized protein [Miltoncostaeaceae bacterium]
MTGAPTPELELMDWKRRIGALYAEVRAGGAGAEVAARFRAARDALFAGHPQSPLPADARAGYAGSRWYPYRDDLRREAALEPEAGGPEMELPVSTGAPARFRRIGWVAVDLGAAARLPVFWLEGYGGGLFLPFRDALAGRGTYGGGRYLLDTVKGADLGSEGGRLVLDFNLAYNPSCSYDARWACPLAPPANRLPIPIRAGERSR